MACRSKEYHWMTGEHTLFQFLKGPSNSWKMYAESGHPSSGAMNNLLDDKAYVISIRDNYKNNAGFEHLKDSCFQFLLCYIVS